MSRDPDEEWADALDMLAEMQRDDDDENPTEEETP